jgi:hypothetical protein
MLDYDSHYGDDSVEWAMNSPIASTANVEIPNKTVVLANDLSFHEYCVLREIRCRQLSKLKLEFEPYRQSRPNWRKIVVKASKCSQISFLKSISF